MGLVNGFQRILETLPRNMRVLDVGAGGLEGENTTNYLLPHVGQNNYKGICTTKKQVDSYTNLHPEADIVVGDFYETEFKEKFDLIVLDLNIANNVERDWTDEGLARVREMLDKDGLLINYVLCTDGYGDPGETPELIRKGWKDFWGMDEFSHEKVGNKLYSLKGWEVYMTSQEERRNYILWVALRRTSGF